MNDDGVTNRLNLFCVFDDQLYAPTTLAPARDFWLLRYTSVLEDGSLVVSDSIELSKFMFD